MRTVLLVEDDALVRLAVAMYLEDEGFRVVEAECGDEALELLQRPNDFDHLVTDIDMPGSTDGVSLSRRFSAAFPQATIVVVSGVARSNMSLPPGATFIQKPFSESALVQALRGYVT